MLFFELDYSKDVKECSHPASNRDVVFNGCRNHLLQSIQITVRRCRLHKERVVPPLHIPFELGQHLYFRHNLRIA